MNSISTHYDTFSKFYDWLSPSKYYEKPRKFAIQELNLVKGNIVLNVACGTGQNFEIFQTYLQGTGLIVGVDFSEGMLAKARKKINEHNWTNIFLIHGDANLISKSWLMENLNFTKQLNITATICDLGLTAMPNWKNVINLMIEVTEPKGRIVIMDWYMDNVTLKVKFLNWIGKADVTRPISQYLKTKTDNFKINSTFNRGGVYVASGTRNR